jgi:hypothetical protein
MAWSQVSLHVLIPTGMGLRLRLDQKVHSLVCIPSLAQAVSRHQSLLRLRVANAMAIIIRFSPLQA